MRFKHQETHPDLDDPNCFACKITHQSIGFHMCPGGKAEWHGATLNERREKIISDAAKNGSTVEPVHTSANVWAPTSV